MCINMLLLFFKSGLVVIVLMSSLSQAQYDKNVTEIIVSTLPLLPPENVNLPDVQNHSDKFLNKQNDGAIPKSEEAENVASSEENFISEKLSSDLIPILPDNISPVFDIEPIEVHNASSTQLSDISNVIQLSDKSHVDSTDLLLNGTKSNVTQSKVFNNLEIQNDSDVEYVNSIGDIPTSEQAGIYNISLTKVQMIVSDESPDTRESKGNNATVLSNENILKANQTNLIVNIKSELQGPSKNHETKTVIEVPGEKLNHVIVKVKEDVTFENSSSPQNNTVVENANLTEIKEHNGLPQEIVNDTEKSHIIANKSSMNEKNLIGQAPIDVENFGGKAVNDTSDKDMDAFENSSKNEFENTNISDATSRIDQDTASQSVSDDLGYVDVYDDHIEGSSDTVELIFSTSPSSWYNTEEELSSTVNQSPTSAEQTSTTTSSKTPTSRASITATSNHVILTPTRATSHKSHFQSSEGISIAKSPKTKSEVAENSTISDSWLHNVENYGKKMVDKYGPGQTAALGVVLFFTLFLLTCCLCQCRKRRKYARRKRYRREKDFLLKDKKSKGVYDSDRMTLLNENSEEEF